MEEKYTATRERKKKILTQSIKVSSKGIELEKGLTDNLSSVKKFAIERIVYCGVDRRHQKIFAFFYRAPDSLYGVLDCHVLEFRSKRDAKNVALKFSQTFLKMAESKEQEKGEYSLKHLNRDRTKTDSMIQLHCSVESVNNDSCFQSKNNQSCSSGKMEVQQQINEGENCSRFGDSINHLTHEIHSNVSCDSNLQKTKLLRVTSIKRSKIKSSQSYNELNYVNEEWCGYVRKKKSLPNMDNFIETINQYRNDQNICNNGMKKDKNFNFYKTKQEKEKLPVDQEYMLMNRRLSS
ncbi:low density lipoprotein receptor adapter protein 1-B-like [Xenia sp. Carnegie-2017]|uniref:low density lipoprotein receptor adapter protein 1-B-like n=1 Tax=Xenia sp. Carnegie-2017 TaxID=2897299 RepID=UPI001F0482E0|nr:low density lipoprotein receptor adapter protein 1-B-like [Xenia sp. Carnegie-2017]